MDYRWVFVKLRFILLPHFVKFNYNQDKSQTAGNPE